MKQNDVTFLLGLLQIKYKINREIGFDGEVINNYIECKNVKLIFDENDNCTGGCGVD